MLRHLPFRTRLLAILSLFALVPAAVLTLAWSLAVGTAAPFFSRNEAWENVANSGKKALDSVRDVRLSPGQRAALRAHELELEQSVTQARRFSFVAGGVARLMIIGAVIGLVLLGIFASRVAGHLSRQMGRPLNELVGWTELIAHGKEIPDEAPLRGAPEFNVLRERMRWMSTEIENGREQALEAERLKAFRESARRFAHELKNPLTPIQFALARLDREAPGSLRDALEVLRTETQRLDQMARSFAQFGRLPEGAPSQVDVGELVRYTARAVIPPNIAVEIDVSSDMPMVLGHHDALQRALSNVLLNAVDACSSGGRISVAVDRSRLNGTEAVRIAVRDSGCGVPEGRIETIWEPYITSKPGGTGLGLAIARQTILAHHGTVAAHSLPERGTEILFVLPVQSSSGVSAHISDIPKVISPTSEVRPQSSPIGSTDFPAETPISTDR
jgi:signal transduction histidine kinase